MRPTWTTRRQAWGLFVGGATVRVAVIVGTVLSVANQGAILIGGDLGYLAGCRLEPGQADGSSLGED